MKHEVYFEIYGKKLKVVTQAKTKEQAIENVKNAIVFHKIRPISEDFPKEFDEIFNSFKDIFNGKK